jgi:hypothetical protein
VESIFSSAFGVEPETITNKPAASESSAIGSWDGFRLEVKRTLNRIDCILQAIPSEVVGPMPLINDTTSVLPKFSSLVAKWASSQAQGVTRIALGCNAFLAVENVEVGYIKLKELIKVIEIDVNRFKELRFQVNLPFSSSVSEEITINRLSNWAVIGFRAALIGLEAPRYFDEMHYVSCSLDVNTNAERTQPISSDLLEKLTEELSLTCSTVLEAGIS